MTLGIHHEGLHALAKPDLISNPNTVNNLSIRFSPEMTSSAHFPLSTKHWLILGTLLNTLYFQIHYFVRDKIGFKHVEIQVQ